MAIEQNRQTILLYALDFGEVYAEFCTELQIQVAQKLNVNPDAK